MNGHKDRRVAHASSVLSLALLVLAFGTGCESDTRRPPAASALPTYRGVGDASAAAGLDSTTFVVADDEHNSLRLYRLDQASDPMASVNLVAFLKPDPEDSEADIEAAARLGSRIYWITSHDTNKRGVTKANRDYFFATEARQVDGCWTLEPAGTASRSIVQALMDTPVFQESLRTASSGKSSPQRKDQATGLGLKIEGMCAAPDGKRLLIGFRQPRLKRSPEDAAHAMVIFLENPEEVVNEGAEPRFGPLLLWDLDNLAIRGMEYSPAHQTVLVVAGPEKDGPHFSLYRWDGDPAGQPTWIHTITTGPDQLTPESLVTFPGQDRVLIISDDGDLIVPMERTGQGDSGSGEHMRNKEISDPAFRRFRTLWIDVQGQSPPTS
ncbi:MAG: hypothetical protein AMXMBFR13_40400 [Phycisphaerae bacterium]